MIHKLKISAIKREHNIQSQRLMIHLLQLILCTQESLWYMQTAIEVFR
jgi:hypothetical protein